MGECISARLCDDSSANDFNFVQSRKRPLEDISSRDGNGVIPKSKKIRNLISENSSLLHSRKLPLEVINNLDDNVVNPERKKTCN